MTGRFDFSKVAAVNVTRSFSRKVQLAQYEPIEVFASVEALLKPEATEAEISRLSTDLNDFVIREVESDIDKYIARTKPPF